MKFATFNDVSYALGIIAKRMAFVKKKEADMNEKINAIRQKFDVDTAEAQTEIDLLKTDIEKFCLDHKSEFDQTRTLEFTTGKVGFRTNPPKVLQLNKKFTIATTLELIKKIFKGAYIRIKEEIDKDALLSDYRNKTIADDKLASVGLRIDQGETFFIEPDWEKMLEEKTKSKVAK